MVFVALRNLFEEFEKHSIEDIKNQIELIRDSQQIVLGNFEFYASEKCKENVENGIYHNATKDFEGLIEIGELIGADLG